ncbi:oligosaccharide flippase family protein [Leadbetterella byssophila]|uniref:oligosaccharide flippase family protein n=1 Tax=Leadbetterella byssophila TaxID=316068 RepID=UPI0039A1C0DE
MGVIIRESLKNSIVNYTGVLIGTLNVLFVYNKLLSTEENGLYAILLSFPVVSAGFINLGVPHVIVRFFNRFADVEKKYHGIFTFLLTVPLIGFIVFLVLFFLFQDFFKGLYSESPQLVQYFWALPLLTFSMLYQTLLEAYCRVHFKVVVPAIVREIGMKLANTFLVVAYFLHLISFQGVVIGLALIYLLVVVLLLFYVKRLGKFFLVKNWDFVRSPLFPEMIKYGLWTMIGSAAATALPHLEKLILPMFDNGLTHTAIFNIALSIALVISIPRNTIASVSDPVLARAWAEGNVQEVQTIYHKSALNLCIIGLFLFLGVWTNIDSIFEIIPNPDKYKAGKWVVLLIGLANVFDMSTGLNSEILKNSKYYKVDFFLFLFRFVLLSAMNFVLIPTAGYNGAAWAILLSTVLYNLSKFAFIWYKFGMQPFNLNTVKVLLLAAAAFGSTLLLDWHEGGGFIPNVLEIAAKGLAIVAIFGGGVYFWRISPDLNNVLDSLKRK